MINHPNCQIIVEDFLPNSEFSWTFVHDEMQYCISEEMEVELWLPPLYSESKKAHITPDTVFSYPLGARKHVKVIEDVPFRH